MIVSPVAFVLVIVFSVLLGAILGQEWARWKFTAELRRLQAMMDRTLKIIGRGP